MQLLIKKVSLCNVIAIKLRWKYSICYKMTFLEIIYENI